jgi:hypothetical protein
LLPDSPAVNAGDPAARASVDGVPVGDQRGAQFTRVYGGRIDIGAFERQPTEFRLGDFNRDNMVDTADLILYRKAMGRSDELASYVDARGNADGVVDQCDYALWRANFGNHLDESEGSSLQDDSIEPAAQLQLPPTPPTDGSVGIRVHNSRRAPARSGLEDAIAQSRNDALFALLEERRIDRRSRIENSLRTPISSSSRHAFEQAVDVAVASLDGLSVLSIKSI